MRSFLLLTCCIYLIGCQPTNQDQLLSPAGNIPVYENHKEGEGLGDRRRQYIELIHKTAPGTDWRQMDQKARNKFAQKRQQRKLKTKETFANGLIEGEWVERGSANQAGSLVALQYQQLTDEVYAVSDGGTVWKSKLDGNSWKPLTDDWKFNPKILQLVDLPSSSRILACQNKQVYYSDDDGFGWTQSTGLNFGDNWGLPISLLETNNGDLYYLVFTWNFVSGNSEMWLYRSTNGGTSFNKLKEFKHGADFWQARNYTRLWATERLDKAYVIHLGKEIYELDGSTVNSLTQTANLPSNKPYDLEGSVSGNAFQNLFVLVDNKTVYKSSDGVNWNQQGETNTNTWDIGIEVKEWDESVQLYGEVECYRSTSTGANWSRINTWASYYSNLDKLHADIMDIQFFQKMDGTDFLLVSNHGGLHVSYNDGVSFTNISRHGLNVAQYYDVRTDPIDPSIVYAGSQDQGHQRTTDGQAFGIENFEQVTSGDYGHMAFSRNDQSLWTNYPAIISYDHNPRAGYFSSFYCIPGDNKAVAGWIAPTVKTTNFTDNSVYVAGGNINGGTGSYLIKLTAQSFSPYNISASQFDFDFRANSNLGQSTISAIANSPLDEDKLYVTTADGTFFYSNDGGISWNKSNSFNGPTEIWIIGMKILPSSTDANVVWLAGSGYSSPAVFKSTNGGLTFTQMALGLPNTLVYDIEANEDESLIFAGTELGPYIYIESENSWYSLLGDAAPLQTYNSVEFLADQQIARYATYGRGMWDFHLDKNCEIFSEISVPILNNSSVEVLQTIEASSKIDPNLTVTFDAGESILLDSGFEVSQNTNFTAIINGCQ